MIYNPFEQFKVNGYELRLKYGIPQFYKENWEIVAPSKTYYFNDFYLYLLTSEIRIYLTDTIIISIWIILFYGLLFFIMLLKKEKYALNTTKRIFMFVYEFVYTNVRSYLPEEGKIYFPFLYYLFLFIITSNIIGILPYSYTITSHLSITFSLAFIIWFSALIIGIQKNGLQFFSIYIPGGIPFRLIPFIVAIEIISYLFRSVSLALRLFANIVAGHILLDTLAVAIHKLLYPAYFTIINTVFSIVPFIIIMILIVFECIVAILQGYIFLILSRIYLKDVFNVQNH